MYCSNVVKGIVLCLMQSTHTAVLGALHDDETPPCASFRGVSLNYIKAMPSTAIGFTVYDQLKSYLGVQGHGGL